MLQKEKIEQLSTDNDELKFTTCGISRGTVKYYLKKNNIKFKIVRDDEKPEFVILTNRTIDTYIYSKNINEKTCFDKHKNENILEVKRNGLTLSAIQSIN